MDATADGIHIVDADTMQLIDVNETACGYLGYTRDYLSATGGETHLAYQIYGARVYRNAVVDTGQDGLQIGNFVEDAEVHDNDVRGAARENMSSDTSSLQLNSGTEGYFYDNVFSGGTGVNVQGGCTGGSLWIFSNVIDRGVAPTGAT